MLNYNDLINYGSINPTVQYFIRDYEKTMSEALRIKRNWNNTIRAFYRDAMGISRLSTVAQIDISVAPDEWLLEMIDKEFPKLDINETISLRALSSAGRNHNQYLPDTLKNNMLEIVKYCDSKLLEYNIDLLIKRLFENYEGKLKSPFGVYRIKPSSIELYLLPIVIFCKSHNLDFETFFIIILAHEIAHLYNHVGEDKDGYYWRKFSSTDTHLAEGLAQYYTWAFLHSYEDKLPGGKFTFRFLEKRQAEEYRWFRLWKSTWEQTYFAFIDSRRNDVTDHREFLYILEKSKERIKDDEIPGFY